MKPFLATAVIVLFASSFVLAGDRPPQQQNMKDCNADTGARA